MSEKSAEAFFGEAMGLVAAGRPAAAEPLLMQAVALKPDYIDAHYQLANLLHVLGRYDEAFASLDRVLKLNPDVMAAYFAGGNILSDLQRFDAALAAYDRAIALKPDFAPVHSNRGNALRALRRYADAIASYDRAIALEAGLVAAHYNRANTLREAHRYEDAVVGFDQAIALKPDFAEAHAHRGSALLDLRRFDQAADSYALAVSLNPDTLFAQGLELHCRMHTADWDGFEARVERVREGIARGVLVSPPFITLALPCESAVQLRCAEMFSRHISPQGKFSAAAAKLGGKIKLGYFSAEFHDHPVMTLIAELFERHDRAKFELVGFSYGPSPEDEKRRRVMAAFDRFIDVRHQTDQEIAKAAQDLGIDIAIDLSGHTANGRLGLFAYRPAPVQIHYLGYPGTLGSDQIDYLIADQTLIPEAARAQYCEKIISLPDTYQATDTRRTISTKIYSRAELSLPDDEVIFCCFNNTSKITPDVFDVWMRILKRVARSRLWLLQSDPKAASNLRKEARARGVDPDRLIFAPFVSPPEHLARQGLADLFLDTFHYNAHTTASDALWAGLPVLTLLGQTFAGRVAASVLRAAGLPELVTLSRAQYEDLAVELALDRSKLAAIKAKLVANKSTAPLFDAARFARNIEAAYSEIWQQYQAGLAPDHILIAAKDGG